MNVVDSSGWLEYLSDGPNARFFAPAIERPAELIVPTISIFEVFKRVLMQRGESPALETVALMHQGRIVELTTPLAIEAARISKVASLPMADSIMLATARAMDAVLWTQDADFDGVEGVRFIRAAKR